MVKIIVFLSFLGLVTGFQRWLTETRLKAIEKADTTYDEATFKKLQKPDPHKADSYYPEKLTGCFCNHKPKFGNYTRKLRYFCGYELKKGGKGGDHCVEDAIYRCMGPGLEAVLKLECREGAHPRPKEYCSVTNCGNDKCIVERGRYCGRSREDWDEPYYDNI